MNPTGQYSLSKSVSETIRAWQGRAGPTGADRQTDWPRCWVVIWLLWTCCSVRLILCWCCSWVECEYSWVEYCCCTCCCWCCSCSCCCWYGFGFCRCILSRYISLYIIENDNQIDAVVNCTKIKTPLDHFSLWFASSLYTIYIYILKYISLLILSLLNCWNWIQSRMGKENSN